MRDIHAIVAAALLPLTMMAAAAMRELRIIASVQRAGAGADEAGSDVVSAHG